MDSVLSNLFSAQNLHLVEFSYQVLVDAECTHDGSIRHIQKFEQWGWTTLQRRVLDAERTDFLTVLQVHKLSAFTCMNSYAVGLVQN